MKCTMKFDTSILDGQINELVGLFSSESVDSIELLKDSIFSDGGDLLFDVVFCESSAATGTLCANEVLIGLKFGGDFERLVATLRARKIDGAHEFDSPIVGDAVIADTSNVKLTGAARLYRAASSDRRERG